MLANAAQYFLSIADINSSNFEVTGFSGEDAISSPYWFDIEFRMSGAGIAANIIPPPNASILDKSCRFDIKRNGETISYCGIVVKFRVCNSDDSRYVVRLAPRMHRLSLSSSNRIFQNLTIPEIIEKVVKKAELGDFFRLELNPDIVKFPKREFCVQHQETDLAFISRLMEESGIWYYFKQVKQPSGVLQECAIATNVFSSYPILNRPIPFKKGSGLAEITETGDIVESIHYISAETSLMPKLVRVRAYNHRYPEGAPDGFGHVPDGHLGRVYEYGGIVKNCHEAEYRATLYARRLWVENSRVDGKGNCASFRAGLCVPIMVHNDNQSISGKYLLVSVKHTGGWERGAYTYRNEFSCVRSEKEVFAPPLRTPIPRIDGVTTAPVGATGDLIPTLNEYGDYNVNMPFALDEDREKSTVDGLGDYGRSKDIRLAQPSGGMSDNGLYGIHFPSKRGAEMVLAYVDGNPDRPLGLGFVPNAAALSVVRNSNRSENVIRTWGGNELVMDDTRNNKSVKLSSAGERYLELHDGDELVRVKSENCEMLFSDADKYALINAGGHIIHINYDENNPQISIKTINEHEFNLSDKDKTISVKTTDGCEMIMNDKNGSISISNASHSVTGDLLLESRGDIRIKAAGEVAISGAAVRVSSEEKEVEVKAKTFLNVSAENITQQANENMEIQGQKIDIHGSANLYMESNNTTVLGKAKVVVESDSQAKIESGGVLVVKSKAKTAVEGGLVTVN